MTKQENTKSMGECRKGLALLWSVGFIILFMILMLQTFSGKYEIPVPGETLESKAKEAWSWFLPTVFPTFSLIITVYLSNRNKDDEEVTIEKFKYSLARGLSFTYLLFVGMIFFLGPFFNKPQLELMKISSFGLGPFQGLVCGMVGNFFASRETKQDSKKSSNRASPKRNKRKKHTLNNQKGNKSKKRG